MEISVIIPTYNRADILCRAIDSVLSQTYQDFEIIIVDDGSTDKTKEVLDEYMAGMDPSSSRKIKYIYKENGGAGSARNAGIDAASGDYIAFLDADDFILKDSLLYRINFLMKNPGVDLVFTDYYIKVNETTVFNEESRAYKADFWNKLKKEIKFSNESGYILKDSFYSNFLYFTPFPICTITVMLKKCILSLIGKFREDISIGEDRDFWMRIVKNHTAGYINKPLSCYNNFQSSVSKNTVKYCRDRIKVFRELFSDAEIDRRLLKKLIANEYFELGYYYYKSNFYLESKWCFIQSFIFSKGPLKVVLFIFAPPIQISNIFRRLKNAWSKT